MTGLPSVADVLGGGGAEIVASMRAALEFLDSTGREALLARVGQTIGELPAVVPADKSALQDSFGGSQTAPCDDLLAGRGMFYVTEQRRLMLDCTSGHYQMLLGYSPPDLWSAIAEAVESGVVWDNHANVPQTPVKNLAHRLVEWANPSDAADRLDTVHLGCCTGSVACEAALKMQLVWFERRRGDKAVPVVVVLDGNYHGTDVIMQYLRGMWGRYVSNVEVATVQPNDPEGLEGAFRRAGPRAAAFWAEPVMMNREAIPLDASYLRLARRLCDESGAVMCLDEIQTGFWQPEMFAYGALGVVPDMVVVGKGMTAGFHPLAAVVYKSRYDFLAQYDAINTNGSAALASYVGLWVMDLVARQGDRIARVGDRYMQGLHGLAEEFGDVVQDARGLRHMGGLKFRRVEDAMDFHRRAVASGLWVRVHAYHPGHSTVLTKLALAADERVVDFVLDRFRGLLRSGARRRS
jgi:acetylornithine/succinyldiaminopimelate/putrescine aminotransferase